MRLIMGMNTNGTYYGYSLSAAEIGNFSVNVEWSIDLGLCVAKFAANWRYVPTEPDRQMLDIGNMIESSIFTAHLPCPCQSMRPHARLRSAIPTNTCAHCSHSTRPTINTPRDVLSNPIAATTSQTPDQPSRFLVQIHILRLCSHEINFFDE